MEGESPTLRTPFLQNTTGWLLLRGQKKSLASRNAGDEKNLHPGGRNLYSIFCRYFLFFFSFFCFFCIFLFVCFLKLKTHILPHIRLFGRVSDNDKKIFTRPISGNKTTCFWPELRLLWNWDKEITKVSIFLEIRNPKHRLLSYWVKFFLKSAIWSGYVRDKRKFLDLPNWKKFPWFYRKRR